MSMHMQQSQSMSVVNNQASLPQQHQQQQQQNATSNHQLVNNNNNNNSSSNNHHPNNNNNPLNNFNPQAADFSLEFLDNLPTSDTGPFTDQELLNSFDSDNGFSLDF